MKVIGGLVVALLAAVGIVVAQGGQPASGQDDEKVVLNIGMQQGIDNMNVVRGVTVAAFEAWNMQFATLTDKAAEDFAPVPGLAESWTSSADKKTWTYKLRPDMKWSDGEPLTAEDVAYTINRSRDEAWLNHSAIVANLKARAISPTELEVKTSVPDPKLPTLDVYIVPKHVYEKYDEKALTKYNGQTDVGSGPFTLAEFKKGQFARFKANPNYFGEKPAIDEVVIRVFNNGDAMVAALKSGEIDFVQNVPETAFLGLQEDSDFVTVEGSQGGFDEFAMNGGDGLKKGHPALSDIEGARGDRTRDRQEDDRRPRRARAGHAGRRREPVGEPGLDAGDPRGPALHVRPRRRQADPRGRRLQGHGRRRRARDARRRPAAEHALRGAQREHGLGADRRVHLRAGSRRSGSPRPRRRTTTASSRS